MCELLVCFAFLEPDKVNHVGPGLLPAASALLEIEVDSVNLEVVFPSGNLRVENVVSWGINIKRD